MKNVIWFFLFVLIGCNSSHQDKKTALQKCLSKIPLQDQQKLETLFHHMMTGDYFASTLFGNKPMTFQEFHDDPWKLSTYAMVNPYYHFYMDEGWKTWLKYQVQFPSSQFIFTKIPSKVGYEFIILINKTAFRKIFDKNHDLFQKALGSRITVEEIFKNFQGQEKTLAEILNDDEALVGLVLGYGREASSLSYRNHAITTEILRKRLHPLAPPCEDDMLPKGIQTSLKLREKRISRQGMKWHQLESFDIVDVEDPYTELNKSENLSDFFHPTWQELIIYILPPNFSCIKNSAETEQLRREYGSAMQLAREAFKKKSFLRGFLEQYCKQGQSDV